jgi:hypothetical protein
MIMLWASRGAKKQKLFIARCLDLWKLVHLWALLDALWSKRSRNSEVKSIVEHPYLSGCFCRQKLWNVWLKILKQYKTVLAREESCWSCVRQVSTFFSNRVFGLFHFLFCKNLAGSGKIPTFKIPFFHNWFLFRCLRVNVPHRPHSKKIRISLGGFAIGRSVTTSSTDFSFWLFGIYLNFQPQKSLKNQYLPHSESKSYQINSIKSCSSRSFQQHQRHIPIPPKFSATI